MATRFYMPYGQSAPPVTVTKHAEWDSEASNVLRQPLVRTIPAGLSGTYTFSVSEGSPTVHDQLCGQYISEPLTAQNITGTVTGVWATREAGGAYDFGTQVVIRVVSYNGSVVRGTLYGPHTYTATTSTGSAVDREFASTATWSTRKLPGGPGTLTDVYSLTGDRLVVEIGARACNLVATTRTADPLIQLRDDWPDDSNSESGLVASRNYWIELSANLTFDPTYSLSQFSGWGVPIR